MVGSARLVGHRVLLVNVAKEKFGMALLGLLVPLVGMIGAFRLGKPHSLWAKLFYRHGQARALEGALRG